MEEPLVATGDVSTQENQDLEAAIDAFRSAPAKAGPRSDFDDYAKPLIAYVAAHPQSNWNAAICANVAFGYYRSGYYSRTFTYLKKAWEFGRGATSPQARLMVDRAVGELAKMHARVGHSEELEALFKDIGNRPIGGPATELIQGAREGLWTFRVHPEIAYLCGPSALGNLLSVLRASPKQIKIADNARSGPHGFSLRQLAELSDKAQLRYKLIYRSPGQPVPVPAIINLTTHHYAAIVGKQDGFYELKDPTFGSRGGTPFTVNAIDSESSGYFIVPEEVLEANPESGWRTLAADTAEASQVYGMGTVYSDLPGTTTPMDTKTCQQCSGQSYGNDFPDSSSATESIGMANASGHITSVSLNLTDTPVGYKPQKGVSARTTLTYNSREAEQPANFSFSNVGPKWTHNWISYIEDIPAAPGYSVTRVISGGGGYDYSLVSGAIYNSSTGAFIPETYDNSQLFRVPATGPATSYERHMPDGSKEVYGLSNGANTYPRYMFLTQVADPAGNVTTLNYDARFRLTSVVDAMGRSTTFTYGISEYPLLITEVTDAFGRTSQLTYDTSQRLASITDAIGITSSFTYGSSTEPDFITKMTTPYGTSKFSDTPNPHDPAPYFGRSLAMTDPMGYVDFLYFYQYDPTPPTDPAAIVPTGMSNDDGLLEWRNTYYWDRHASALGVTTDANGNPTAENFAYSDIYHWLHFCCGLYYTSNSLGSIKKPLENRVWMNYPGMATSGYYYYSGTLLKPTITGRVLDDGTTQLSTATYNPLGNPLTQVDPKGRSTKFSYAGNNVDLLTTAQLTAPSTYTTIATYGNYNAQHEPQTYTGADGQTWQFAYNSAGQITSVTDPTSAATNYIYDGVGRLQTVINANGATALALTYDTADRVLTRTDSEGYTLTYTYDNLDRVTSVTYPDGTTDLYDYTFQSGPSAGTPSLDLRKHTDRLGNVTTYAYDADRRLSSVTEPISSSASRTTSYDYYENGTLKDIVDANGNVTHWNIDVESRPVSKTYAYGTSSAETETYTYENTTSRLHAKTDALGQTKTLTYAADDRVTGIAYAHSVNTTPNIAFAYDTYFPRLTSMTDGSGTTSYGYYPIGALGGLRLQSEATPFVNGTILYAYDPLSRLASRTVDTSTETFAYDKLSRLITHGTALGTFNLGYLGQTGQLTSQQISTGTVGTYWAYEPNAQDRRLKSITNSGATRSFNFTTNQENLITQIQETAPNGSAWAPKKLGYSYDDSYRLTQASSGTGTYVYGLDPVDNITSFQLPTGSTSATYNPLNEISTYGNLSYLYDKNGNVLDDGVRTYTWDAENRLLTINSKTNSGQKTVFKYDGRGRRIAIDTTNGITTEVRYLWCGEQLCQARTSADMVTRRYYTEGEYLPLGGTSLYYSQDQLGSVRDVLATQNGGRVATFDYDPYGNPTQSNGRVGTDFRYAGLFYDQQDGLYLTRYRIYAGTQSRWSSRDPVENTNNPDPYGYADVNPISGVDPWGLLTVYIWNRSRTSIGHAAILLDDGTYISRWPTCDCTKSTVLGGQLSYPSGAAKDLQEDTDALGQPNDSISINGLNEKEISTWWRRSELSGQSYNPLFNNCATVAADALAAGGGNFYAALGFGRFFYFIWTPNDIRNYSNAIKTGLSRWF